MTGNPAARLSIVAYKPKPGKEEDLMQLTREHVPLLRTLGLATDRPHIAALASNGTVVEIFEWVEGGVAKAHETPELRPLWGRYAAACDFVQLNSLEEAGQMFANFVPVDLESK